MARELTLEDVVISLDANNRSIKEVGGHLAKFFKMQERSRLDQLEEKREAKRPKAPGVKPLGETTDINKDLREFNKGIALLLNPAKLILPLTAGIAAVGTAFLGLRGWETKAIRALGQITGITPTVSGGVLKIRTAVLKIFGLTPEGALIRNADTGRIMKAPPISTQIATAVSNLRTSALRIFGIGADGKALPIQGADGKFKAAGDFTKFLAASFRGLVSTFQTFVVGPISSIFNIVRTVATGVSSTVGNLVRPIAKIAATFGKLFGKIFYPIGVLFSAVDGFKSFMNSERETIIGRLGDGIAGFVGDFIGAPFDLLKSGISWVTKKFFGEDNFVANMLDSFSFEETIKGLFGNIFDGVSSAVDFVKDLFDFSDLTPLKALGKFIDIVTFPINAAVNFAKGLFGFSEEGQEPFRLSDFVFDKFAKVKEYLGDVFQAAIDYIKTVPGRVMFFLQEKYLQVKGDVMKGILSLGNFLSTLPEKVYVNILDALNKTTVGDYLVSDEALATAKASIATKQASLASQIKMIDDQTARQLGELAARRAAFDEQMGGGGITLVDASQNSGGSSTNQSVGVSLGDLNPVDPRKEMSFIE